MIKQLIISCLFVIFTITTTTTSILAQAWLPDDVGETTILVERFKYQNPDDLDLDIDDTYESQKETFVKEANDNLKKFNTKLEGIFASTRQAHKLAISGKIDKDFEDTDKYRYVLKREIFFGDKSVMDAKTEKEVDKSYFAYRYYFYDRAEEEDLASYYFSGDKWEQLDRIIFWLDSKNKGKKAPKASAAKPKPATKKATKPKKTTDEQIKKATKKMMDNSPAKDNNKKVKKPTSKTPKAVDKKKEEDKK